MHNGVSRAVRYFVRPVVRLKWGPRWSPTRSAPPLVAASLTPATYRRHENTKRDSLKILTYLPITFHTSHHYQSHHIHHHLTHHLSFSLHSHSLHSLPAPNWLSKKFLRPSPIVVLSSVGESFQGGGFWPPVDGRCLSEGSSGGPSGGTGSATDGSVVDEHEFATRIWAGPLIEFYS